MRDEPSEETNAPAPSGELPHGRRIDGRLGCALIFGVGLLSMAGAWIIMQRKAATQLDAATELARLVSAAEAAEGTDALRKAGCAHAAVLPMDTLGGLAQRLENARAEKERREPRAIFLGTERAAIVCSVSKTSPVGCGEVATTFAGAVKHAALPFVVVVERGGETGCTAEYAGDASKMKALEPLAIPPLFPAVQSPASE